MEDNTLPSGGEQGARTLDDLSGVGFLQPGAGNSYGAKVKGSAPQEIVLNTLPRRVIVLTTLLLRKSTVLIIFAQTCSSRHPQKES